MNAKAKWICGLIFGLTLLVAGWAYAQVNARITRLESGFDQAIPILYRIEEKVRAIEEYLRNGH